MSRRIKLVFEKGVFRPVEPVDWIDEHRQVDAVVEVPQIGKPFADWTGGISDADAAAMRAVIEREVEQIEHDDWE